MSTAAEHGHARVDVAAEFGEMYPSAMAINKLVGEAIGEHLAELVYLRGSYLNGCAFCIDTHTRAAIRAGRSERKLFLVAAWREAPDHFTEAERAALALTDEVTRLGEHGVSDEVYGRAAEHFPPRELAALITGIALINFLNRIGVTTHMQPPVRD
ncbi:carboxymuconolactone decarboxylase family protein [Nocardiopsis composta]|uniref:AhpD family alkylhydroperoxidase n=1 Tax=Nocardiopsis composta TaxID=157465 RepID=A0A7W8VE47_9ACTN|nr:carboxymuconolactone decarboxylase family protein [Nocardiopsis composta]MBB5432564.1 AhpD family alkylhydroperoxidase [Nocardiopsis composta]